MLTRVAKGVMGRFAGVLGCELVPRWRVPRLALARHLAELFHDRDVDVVLDVGANKGQYHRFLREDVGFTGDVVSFEPIEVLASHLANAAAGDRRWQVQRCALGRTSGSLTINVMSGDELSSFKTPDVSRVPEFGTWNRVVRTEIVPVRMLDEVWPEVRKRTGARRPYLKMDTQGFDGEVLAGAAATLSEVVALQSEVHVLPLYADTPSYLEEIAHLESLGFALTGLFVVSSDEHRRAIELDCVMLNDRLRP